MSHLVLIVDDEPDIHTATELSLKRMRFQDQKVELKSVTSGAFAVDFVKAYPETAVILMDVVMEDQQAGLNAIHQIRETLENQMVRILLRTGQPGQAPEKAVIDNYDIDGYLSKAEMTQTKLYSAVRSALKSFIELQALQRHRDALTYLNQSLLTLHQSQSLDESLQRLVEIASSLAPSPLTLLYLETPPTDDTDQNNQSHLYFHGPDDCSTDQLEQSSHDLLKHLGQEPQLLQNLPAAYADGYLVPLNLLGDAGQGFIYAQNADQNDFLMQTLPILAAHAALAVRL